jgi:hypothetical protein
MRECDLLALTRAFGSSPETALDEPGMGPHILLIFGARLLLHQRYRLPEEHRLSIQAFDRDRLDVSCWLPDVEALLGGVHPAGDPLASQASTYIVVFAVDCEIALGPYGSRKGSLIDLYEPEVRIDALGNSRQGRKGWGGHTRRLIATGARLIGTLLVVVGKKGLCHLTRLL